MPSVKVLIEGVGGWAMGEIVKDAPPGLVHMATVGTKNAATGELIAELMEDDSEELKLLQAKAKELKISKYTKMSVDELKEAIAAAEETERQKQAEEALKQLQAKAAELNIEGAEGMTAEQLNAEIEAATNGGGAGGQ